MGPAAPQPPWAATGSRAPLNVHLVGGTRRPGRRGCVRGGVCKPQRGCSPLGGRGREQAHLLLCPQNDWGLPQGMSVAQREAAQPSKDLPDEKLRGLAWGSLETDQLRLASEPRTPLSQEPWLGCSHQRWPGAVQATSLPPSSRHWVPRPPHGACRGPPAPLAFSFPLPPPPWCRGLTQGLTVLRKDPTTSYSPARLFIFLTCLLKNKHLHFSNILHFFRL